MERPHRHAAVPTRQHAAQLRRGARALRPQPPSCKPHSSRRPHPRSRYWSVGNRGRDAPTAQYHRLLGLACKPIVGFVMETDLRPQSKGGRVCKEARSARPRTTVVLIVLNLAPRDLPEASMGCVRVRGWQCRTASPGKLVARLFRSVPWPGPGWAGERAIWVLKARKGSLLAACAAEHNE